MCRQRCRGVMSTPSNKSPVGCGGEQVAVGRHSMQAREPKQQQHEGAGPKHTSGSRKCCLRRKQQWKAWLTRRLEGVGSLHLPPLLHPCQRRVHRGARLPACRCCGFAGGNSCAGRRGRRPCCCCPACPACATICCIGCRSFRSHASRRTACRPPSRSKRRRPPGSSGASAAAPCAGWHGRAAAPRLSSHRRRCCRCCRCRAACHRRRQRQRRHWGRLMSSWSPQRLRHQCPSRPQILQAVQPRQQQLAAASQLLLLLPL